jgi:hypothetical protein
MFSGGARFGPLAPGLHFPNSLRAGKEKHRASAMNDSLKWAAHYRQRAVECTELADNSFDPGIEAHYRTPAGRCIKLAEAEEDAAARYGGQNLRSPGLGATG